LQKIYNLGARRFFTNNIAPLGCFPSFAPKPRPRGECNEKINRAISYYNNRLPNVLQKLQSQLPGFTFMHSDLYEFFMDLRENGYKYGKKKLKWIFNVTLQDSDPLSRYSCNNFLTS